MCERVVKLLTPFRETSLHDTEKTIALLWGKRHLWVNIDAQNRRIYFGCWIKRACRNTRNNMWSPIKLNAHRQQTQVSRSSRYTLCHLQLDHHHKQAWGIPALQKVAKGWRCYIVWQISDELVRTLCKNLVRIELQQVTCH